MQLTNRFELPQAVVRALSHDDYSKGDADFSVTELLDSPRVRVLQRQHWDEIVQDVTDNFYSVLGRAVHKMLETGADAAGETPEERLFLTVTTIDGLEVTVSGSMDLQHTRDGIVDIYDYKVTSVLSATSDKSSWEQQLNIYAYLVERVKGAQVSSLTIVAFLRDWRRSSAERDAAYPQSPIITVSIPKWSSAKAARFLQDRVQAHIDASSAMQKGELPELCNEEERWEGSTVYPVIKPGGRRALKVFDDASDAEAFAKANSKLPGEPLIVERRGGEPRRCLGNWCKVAAFCDYGRALQGAQEFI